MILDSLNETNSWYTHTHTHTHTHIYDLKVITRARSVIAKGRKYLNFEQLRWAFF